LLEILLTLWYNRKIERIFMMIFTKGGYALRFLSDVAEHRGDGFVLLKGGAVRQEVSEKYLEIVVKELAKGGLLTVLRGRG